MKYIVVFLFLSILTMAGLTPVEKIAAIDAKIKLCDTKPELIVAEKTALYDMHIRWVEKDSSFGKYIQSVKAKALENQAQLVAKVRARLVAEKADIQVSDPNVIEGPV